MPDFHWEAYMYYHFCRLANHFTKAELQDFRKKPAALPPYLCHTQVIERVMGGVTIAVESERLPLMPSEVLRGQPVSPDLSWRPEWFNRGLGGCAKYSRANIKPVRPHTRP